MTTDKPAPTPLRSQPAVRGYTILCLTALMAMVLALMENDRELLGVLVLAVLGGLAVIARWRSGPALLLLGLAVLDVIYIFNRSFYVRLPGFDDSPFMDAVLCAAVLTYAAGHYRLLSLTHTAFPIDYRRPPPRPGSRDGARRPPFDGRHRRSAHLPGPWEMPALALTAAAWAVGASLLWLVLSALAPPRFLVVDPRSAAEWQAAAGRWRALLLIFLVGATTAVLWGAAAYLDWATAAPEEHLLFLQDEAWRETRPEQNRINRFMAWARLRGQRRKEKS